MLRGSSEPRCPAGLAITVYDSEELDEQNNIKLIVICPSIGGGGDGGS